MTREKWVADRSELARAGRGTFVTALRRRVAIAAWAHYGNLPATREFIRCKDQIRQYMVDEALNEKSKPTPAPTEKPVAEYAPEEAYKLAFNKVRRQIRRYESWSYFKNRVMTELGYAPLHVRVHVEVARLLRELWESVKGDPNNAEYLELSKNISSVPTPSQPETTKEPIMANASTPFEVITFVYGSDVKSMSEEQLIDSIKRAEADIAKLNVVKTASKKLEAKKAELQAAIDKMVEALDAK